MVAEAVVHNSSPEEEDSDIGHASEGIQGSIVGNGMETAVAEERNTTAEQEEEERGRTIEKSRKVVVVEVVERYNSNTRREQAAAEYSKASLRTARVLDHNSSTGCSWSARERRRGFAAVGERLLVVAEKSRDYAAVLVRRGRRCTPAVGSEEEGTKWRRDPS